MTQNIYSFLLNAGNFFSNSRNKIISNNSIKVKYYNGSLFNSCILQW